MPDDHARATLGRLLGAEIAASADAVLDELLGIAPEAAEPAPPVRPRAAPARDAYDLALDNLERFARALEADLAAQAASAEATWRELARHPQARRLILVRHQRRLHSWGLFDHILREARRLAPEDPLAARRRFELALELAPRLRHPWLSPRHVEDLRAACLRGLAEIAHLLGEARGAEAALVEARRALREGTGDLLERAHLLRLRSRVAADAGRRGEAVRCLEAARAICARLRATDLEARAALDRAQLAGHRDPRRAAELLRGALDRIGPRADPRLALALGHQLAWFVNDVEDLGGPAAARQLVAELRPAYLAFSDAATTVRRRWLEGRILRNLERLDEAEALLGMALGALAELGGAADQVLCALDLLELYGHAGRRADLARLDRSCRRRLRSWGAHPDALAAWARAVARAGDRAAVREVALLFREGGRQLLQPPEPRRRRRETATI